MHASCVLIQRDGKILALHRADGKGYALPVGKQDPGERYSETAVRECFEETGFVCVVTGSPFVMDRGEFTVTTYRATIVAEGVATHAHEGTVEWVDPAKLVEDSDFEEYNRLCFKYFDLDT